jgi:hypothetical protein
VTTDRPTRNEVFGKPPAGIQSVNVMRDDFGFEIPIESIPIPSNGVVYNTESPLHNRETVDVRAMTAKEEDILTSRAFIKKGTVITELIKSCLIDKRINVDEMISGDRNALMISLRITGYGSEYDVDIHCPECGTKSKQAFDLANLGIKRLEIDPAVAGENLFEYDLPVTKQKVQFKFLDGNDENDINVMLERRKKRGFQADNHITTRLKACIVSVGNIKDKAKLSLFVQNMPARDSMMLRRFIDKNEPGIDMNVEMDCPHCSECSEVALPLGASFFWPDAE